MKDSHLFAQRNQRSAVTPFEIKGSVATNGKILSTVVLIWNISDTGVCIWTDGRFKKGEFVKLTIEYPWTAEFDCEVRWCRTVPDRSGFILGLMAENNKEQLSQIHKEVLIKQKIVV